MQVAHLDAFRRGGHEPAHHLGRVGGVRHQEDVVVGAQIDDQVVDYATGDIVGTQRVLRAAGAMRVLGSQS